MERAEKAYTSRLFSVTNKTGMPASGNKNDYYTIAPYFWPNPNTPDSLPYIRKDGEINPQARTAYTDFNEGEAFFKTIGTLGKAYFITEDEKYADKANQMLNTWFVDSATMMNPHLNYAQGIPGVNEGRCFGIIEFGGLGKVITTVELLKIGNDLNPTVEKGFNAWINQYIHWLETSEFGIMESTRSNNHAVYYDKQICGLYWYLGEKEVIKDYLDTTVRQRIITQIEPDGRMPHELGRTKAFTYSAMNLRGFMNLANYGKRVGVDLWNFESEDGRSLKRGYEFLADYLKHNRPWDYQQITTGDYYRDFAHDLKSVGESYDIPEFIGIATEYLRNSESK